MKNIKKYIILAIVLIVVIAFAGCAEFYIDAKITSDNLVTYSYTLSFADLNKDDANYTELQLLLMDIHKYWEENGAVCEMNVSDDSMELIGTFEKQCATQGEAFDTLYSFMTNEITVFEDVAIEYNDDYYTSDYSLNCTLDLTGIVDKQIYEIHPAIVTEDVDEFMKNANGKITISLPFNDDINAVEISQNEMVENIVFDAPVKAEISGIINNNQLKQDEKDLLAERDSLKSQIGLFTTLAIISLVLSVVLIGVMVFLFVKSRKRKEDVKED